MADFIFLSDFCTYKNFYKEKNKWIEDQPNHFINKSTLFFMQMSAWCKQREWQ